MSSVNRCGCYPDMSASFERSLSKRSEFEETAEVVGNHVSQAEQRYLNAVKKENPDEGEVVEAKMKFERMTRVLEGLNAAYDKLDERIRRGIQALANK